MPGPVVTLTTDFGVRDPSVAMLKGIVLQHCPAAQIVDLGHDLPRDPVAEGAMFVAGSAPFFPEGTIHLVNIAPGAAPLIVATRGQTFVCPDNGVLSFVLGPEPHAWTIPVAAATGIVEGGPGEQVYYGRDILAPAAGRLAAGSSPDELGQPFEGELNTLELREPTRLNDTELRGQVVHVNRFGNLITNIHRSAVAPARLRWVRAGSLPVRDVVTSYSDVPPGMTLTMFGPDGFLEIACNGDRADTRLGLGVGIYVTAKLAPPEG